MFDKFVNSADYAGHNGMSNIFCQILKVWGLDDNSEENDQMKNIIELSFFMEPLFLKGLQRGLFYVWKQL